jgi:hypothetical protein
LGAQIDRRRSFGFSVLLHQLALLMVVPYSRYAFVRTVEAVLPRFETAVPVDKTLYVPRLGGGSEGSGKQRGGSGSEPRSCWASFGRTLKKGELEGCFPNLQYHLLTKR